MKYITKWFLDGKKQEIDEILNKIPVTPMLHRAFKNQGNLHFLDQGNAWGFTTPSFANGAAYGDLDNDGDLDMIINNENGPAFVYKNNAREINKNHFVGVLLKGTDNNTYAIGSKISLYKGDTIFNRELIPSRGFQSSVDYKQIIGLGDRTQIDSMVILWPNRTSTKIDRPKVDSVYAIQQLTNSSRPALSNNKTASSQTLSLVKSNFDKHIEDNNIDFYYERNLPKLLSKEGPKLATGDVNADGLDDVYIAGTTGTVGQLYIQTSSGVFVKKEEPAFRQFADFEDGAVLFFDADNDGDLDLVIAPGGNNQMPFTRQMQIRLFKNDGKGNFTLDPDGFNNKNGSNLGVVIANDFNHDGFPDLFIGGRNTPREYGIDPTSYLFVNDGKGHFSDIAKSVNPDIANIGMVTSAVWADVTGNADKELIIAGEWMAPRIFTYSLDRFVEVNSNLSNLFGWWQTVATADLNGDGKLDLVLGNVGENFYLHPNAANPVKLWLNDFDQNGTRDNIMTRTVNGADMPVFLKRDMEDQIPYLKKQNLKHGDFAKKTIQELFSPQLIGSAIKKQFNYCSSIIAINKGNGQFEIQEMPARLQMSSVNTILCTDVNKDGNIDLVVGGNEFGFLPQFGRLDGSFGDILLNTGKGKFERQNSEKSGLELKGQVRSIREIKSKNERYLLFGINEEYPVLYKINN